MVESINHVTLAVRDLDRSFSFYTGALGLHPVARWDTGAYLAAGEHWITLILDPATREGPLPEYTHLAFSVSANSLAKVSERLREAGAEVWQVNATEGISFYFTDPDGHKLEIRTSGLAARLAADRREPPAGMRFSPEF